MSRLWRLLALVVTLGGVAQAAPAMDKTDIRDIRGPLPSPREMPWWLIGAGVALTGGAAMIVHRLRRRPRTPEQLALAALDRALPLAEAGRPREYAIAVSSAVRAFLQTRLALPITTATTEELLHDAVDDPRLADRREPLGHFLIACDLAKFAQSALTTDAMAAMHEAARALVAPPTAGQEKSS